MGATVREVLPGADSTGGSCIAERDDARKATSKTAVSARDIRPYHGLMCIFSTIVQISLEARNSARDPPRNSDPHR
jgi:hypothetical protein